MTTRRELIVASAALPVLALVKAARAQAQNKVWRVGYLAPSARPDSFDSGNFGGFRRGMRELGYVEGKNLIIEPRFANRMSELLPGLAAELVQLKVDIILTNGSPATRAAQKATGTIPIVMGSAGDPVGSGFIKSLARPGGNITGLTNISGDLSAKHLELLISMVPKLSRVALLLNPANPAHTTILKNVQVAAQKAGVKVLTVEARAPQEIENALSTMSRENAGAVIVEPDSLFNSIGDRATKHRLPSIGGNRVFVETGGLMSYGPSFEDMFRRAATHVDKILNGARPADIPVEQPTIFEFVINGKTSKALGLTIPPSLMISATKVIE